MAVFCLACAGEDSSSLARVVRSLFGEWTECAPFGPLREGFLYCCPYWSLRLALLQQLGCFTRISGVVKDAATFERSVSFVRLSNPYQGLM